MGALDEGERLTMADADAWRAWLTDNHEQPGGVWVMSLRRSEGDGLGLAYEDAIRQALCFGWIDGPVRVLDGVTGLWFSPRRPNGGWAATNKARLIELEAAGLMAPAGIRAVEMAKANGSWTVLDRSEAGIEPPELAAALDAVPAARENWDAFPKSTKKFGIAMVDMAKRPATRDARIAKIVADAAEGKRP